MQSKSRVIILSFGLALTSIIITPWSSYDPLNLPKQLILLSFAGILITSLSKADLRQILRNNRAFNVVIGLFILQLICVLLFAPGNSTQQFYGASGRQTGFLTYLALAILMFIAANLCSRNMVSSVVLTLVIVSAISLFYGLIQSFNFDPVNWTTPYSPIFGFLGNPNFFSSFIGFSIAPALAYALKQKFHRFKSLVYLIYVLLSFYLIYRSDSKQGFLVASIVLISVIIFYIIKQSKSFIFKVISLSATVLLLITSTLDILQKSPWNSILYESSISYRGDFWRAAFQMGLNHPWFGVGMDSYRDYYFRSRDLVAAQREIAGASVDSAHNVILDMFSSGGFPLALIFVLIQSLIFSSAIRTLKRMPEFDPLFVTIFAAWIGFQAQSLISINVIGLSVWGWVLGGLIFGYGTIDRGDHTKYISQQKQKVKSDSFKLVQAVIGFLIGISIAFPAFKADSTFRTAVDSRSIDLLKESAYVFPQSVVRMNYIARTFELNKLYEISLDIARDSIRFSPETFESWKLIYELPNSSDEEKREAYKRISYLNPIYLKDK